jgi:hypothetical protein
MKEGKMRELLDEYWTVLQDSQLTDSSVQDYYYFAECFVRWISGTFTPGSKLERQQ